MKAIFALCLVLAFASTQCTFTPKWFSCEWETWNTTNVTLDAAPVPGQNSTFTLCGDNLTEEELIFTDIRYRFYDVGRAEEIPLENVKVPVGGSYCFEVSMQILKTKGWLDVYFAMDGDVFAAIGCDVVWLNLGENDQKFLSS